ncbi:MAG TPA: 4-hydroxyphenylacetate 3-hydroxylase N-terminal domain-containing protein [Syntrophomonas sp.]|nr:4-hydroxyphenylacetate 3-hydroxylase N-terminal domain-containing protein [Syntrophomonas sp.]HRW13003.1 4-hydroxyphenylacetate 3-hydroxylase N-terminal domain-containing protein [Syntrophomonas sp.]
MRTSKEYLEKLAKMRPNIYLDGECIGRDHPKVVAASKSIQKTFDLANDDHYGKWLTTTSHISGKPINRFCHIHQSVDDLLMKQEMTRVLCNLVGGCIQRCMGTDSMNGLSVATKNADLKYGTNYHERWLKYLEYFQENDLVGAASQTDAKGDRSKRPAEQDDPDMYLRVVERREDGVVVRGAKLHNTMAPYCDELLVFPTRMLGKNEKDYAIAFAVPADTEGVYLIARQAFSPTREPGMEAPYTELADIESMTVFDNVFVPNERIFLNGETDIGGQLALLFALFHRHSYCGCKPGIGDVMLGTTALLADYNGVEKTGHTQEKLADVISVVELVYAAGIAASVKSTKAPSGTQVPNVIYCNVGRRHAGHNVYHEYDILCDIAGGLPGTLPMTKEYNNPVIGDFVRKYTKRRTGVSEEDHYRAYHLASDILTGEVGAVLLVAGVHGGGSPIMEDIAIMSTYDIKAKKNLAKFLAGIKQD